MTWLIALDVPVLELRSHVGAAFDSPPLRFNARKMSWSSEVTVYLRLLSCLVLAACGARQSVPEAPEADDVATCGGSYAAPSGWREVTLDLGPAAIRLPRSYTKQLMPLMDDESRATFGTAPLNLVMFQEAPGPANLDSAIFPRTKQSPGYSSCRDTVSGRPAIVELARGPSGYPTPDGQFLTFDTRVTISLRGDRYLYIHGISATPEGRREQLLIARTVRILGP